MLTMTAYGFELIKNGEAEIVFWIRSGWLFGACQSYWDISGSYDPRTWNVSLDLSGPSQQWHGQRQQPRMSSTFQISAQTRSALDVGIGPLQGAGVDIDRLCPGLERMLGNETNGSRADICFLFLNLADSEDDPAQGLKDDLGKLKGRTTLIETSCKRIRRGQAGSATA